MRKRTLQSQQVAIPSTVGSFPSQWIGNNSNSSTTSQSPLLSGLFLHNLPGLKPSDGTRRNPLYCRVFSFPEDNQNKPITEEQRRNPLYCRVFSFPGCCCCCCSGGGVRRNPLYCRVFSFTHRFSVYRGLGKSQSPLLSGLFLQEVKNDKLSIFDKVAIPSTVGSFPS